MFSESCKQVSRKHQHPSLLSKCGCTVYKLTMFMKIVTAVIDADGNTVPVS